MEPRRPISHAPLGGEMLRIEGVRKSFGELEVLKGIDLSVAEHEVVALIGASGSGKSTLLRCINLIEPIDAGRIIVGGQEITSPEVSVDKVRRRIGIVYQSYNLFPHMTVLANVTLAPRKVLKLSRDEAEARATELLTRFGLADKKDVHPDRLSGGQQQRVAIVRALAMQPGPAAARRDHHRARPGARVGGAGRRPGAGRPGHDDGHRDPRDGLRAGHREPGLLPPPGQDPGAGAAGGDVRARRGSRRPRAFLERVIRAGRL